MSKSKTTFFGELGFNLAVLRDTMFYVAVSVFPISLIWLKARHVTWYVVSGYLYGLMVSSVMKLCERSRRRETNVGVLVQMLKILVLLSSFVMILLNGQNHVVRIDTAGIAFFTVLFLCLYHETYVEHSAKRK
jgi:uncharacterized membrane protein